VLGDEDGEIMLTFQCRFRFRLMKRYSLGGMINGMFPFSLFLLLFYATSLLSFLLYSIA
jgi:hypothetical protein